MPKQKITNNQGKMGGISYPTLKIYEYDSDADGLRLHPAMLDVQEEILKMFQTAAYEQYTEILERQRQEAL